MSDGSPNGVAGNGMAPPQPKRKTVNAVVGGEEIPVPTLMLQDIEDLAEVIRGMDSGMWWATYAGHALQIVAHMTGRDLKALKSVCSVEEAQNLGTFVNEYLRVSGFRLAGEAEAASPGTGTSSDSPPDSQLAASAEATSTESSEATASNATTS